MPVFRAICSILIGLCIYKFIQNELDYRKYTKNHKFDDEYISTLPKLTLKVHRTDSIDLTKYDFGDLVVFSEDAGKTKKVFVVTDYCQLNRLTYSQIYDIEKRTGIRLCY